MDEGVEWVRVRVRIGVSEVSEGEENGRVSEGERCRWLVDDVEVRGTSGGAMKGAQETQALALELRQNREPSGVGEPTSRPVWGGW